MTEQEKPPSFFKTSQEREFIQKCLQNSFFSALQPEQLERFVDAVHIETFEPNTIILQEGCIDSIDTKSFAGARRKTTELLLGDRSDFEKSSHRQERVHGEHLSPHNSAEEAVLLEDEVDVVDEQYSPDFVMDPGIQQHPSLEYSGRDSEYLTEPPAPPISGIPRQIYVLKEGTVDVWYSKSGNKKGATESEGPLIVSLKAGKVFGEGGFLFGRQHSASVVASTQVECWVLDFRTFRQHVLPSGHMSEIFHSRCYDDESCRLIRLEHLLESSPKMSSPTHNLIMERDVQLGIRIAQMFGLLQKDNVISFQDYCFLHFLMNRPEPEADIAFLSMDTNHRGQIDFNNVQSFLSESRLHLPAKSEFLRRYFGNDATYIIRQNHFPQFFAELRSEMARLVFENIIEKYGQGGYVSAKDFLKGLKKAFQFQLSPSLSGRLDNIFLHSSANDKIQSFCYSDFVAMQHILANIRVICNLICAAERTNQGSVSLDDLLIVNKSIGSGQLTRLQAELVFKIFDIDQDGFISTSDIKNICGIDFFRSLGVSDTGSSPLSFEKVKDTEEVEKSIADKIETHEGLVQSPPALHAFVLGIASSIGPLILYPFDLLKTRLMNQRPGSTKLYSNLFDCFQKTIKTESFHGLYRGLFPQMLGSFPEQMIKLEVNRLFRQFLSSNENRLEVELLAGAATGACQVLMTNPVELVKIRMQLQSEVIMDGKHRLVVSPLKSFLEVVKDIGFSGFFRGASACLIRDVPFSSLYFASFSMTRDFLAKENGGKITPSDLVIAGSVAAIPSTILTTPADTVKTRIQAAARPGFPAYSGVRDCATQIYLREGIAGFFRGTIPRILRIVPHFGITLFAYDAMRRGFDLKNEPLPPTNAYICRNDYKNAFG